MFIREVSDLDIHAKVWFYVNQKSKINGPFSSLDMDIWNMSGYFATDLKVSWCQTKVFRPVQEFFMNPVKVIKDTSSAEMDL